MQDFPENIHPQKYFQSLFYNVVVTLPGKQISLKSLNKDQVGCIINAFVIADEPQSSLTVNDKYTLSNNTLRHGVSLQVIKKMKNFILGPTH